MNINKLKEKINNIIDALQKLKEGIDVYDIRFYSHDKLELIVDNETFNELAEEFSPKVIFHTEWGYESWFHMDDVLVVGTVYDEPIGEKDD